jgi:hypothetical protein
MKVCMADTTDFDAKKDLFRARGFWSIGANLFKIIAFIGAPLPFEYL